MLSFCAFQMKFICTTHGFASVKILSYHIGIERNYSDKLHSKVEQEIIKNYARLLMKLSSICSQHAASRISFIKHGLCSIHLPHRLKVIFPQLKEYGTLEIQALHT